jgi:transmembrane sensor
MNELPDFTDDLQAEQAQRIAMLIAGYIRQTLTQAEHDELDAWVSASDENMLLFEELTDETKIQQALDWLNGTDAPARLKKLKGQLHFTRSRSRRHFRKIWPYAVAACLVLAIGTTIFIISSDRSASLQTPVVQSEQPDVLPGGDKAILTLADGSAIILEQAQDGALATQGNSHIIKHEGQLVYSTTTGETQSAALLNTVTTPRGGSYLLTLSDGTRLWLNAASSIRFPAVFTGAERRVAITGEVYFEVAKNAAMPFKVDVKDRAVTVEVIGTHFDINAYSDEPVIKTTLLEGAVKVASGGKTGFLKPGQQAQVGVPGSLDIVTRTDTEETVAWKNGLFQFTNANITTLMRQLSRWYDVDISYAGAVPDILTTGKAPRNISLSSLLKIIELSGIHYRIEGKKLIVLP